MKKLLFIATIALCSCKKKSCYTCTTDPYPLTQAAHTSIVETKCEYTKQQAKEYEQLHTSQTSICTCNVQDK